jgi:3'(2'), 5'-bisphosphate nucleotidase
MGATDMAATEPLLARIAIEAGAVVMAHYRRGATARTKADHSPVTDADQEAERLILARLGEAFAGMPVVAEEERAAGRVTAAGGEFFLVDPLDGTKEFLSGNGEFTVNIARIEQGAAVAGCVYAPARRRLFYGARGEGAFELEMDADAAPDWTKARRIQARRAPEAGLVVATSRSHPDPATDEFLKGFSIAQTVVTGSSLKFCLLAAGEADLYARGGRTMEWDTAAGQAVLEAAGGTVKDWDGAPLLYGKADFENPAFVARGMV